MIVNTKEGIWKYKDKEVCMINLNVIDTPDKGLLFLSDLENWIKYQRHHIHNEFKVEKLNTKDSKVSFSQLNEK